MDRFIRSQIFGIHPRGGPVEKWTLVGSGGLQLEVIPYGAAITRLLVPDRMGRMADVVLGLNDLDSYLQNRACFGAVAGRVAGRITGARFRLDGKTYELARNDGKNHLHGGLKGFDKRMWTAAPVEDAAGRPSLRLTYHSPDGEEGYPGSVDVAVTYTVADDNAVWMETEASTDRATPFNMTQHTYFNLAGEDAGSIDDHELQIHADEIVLTGEDLTLLGRIESVDGRDSDFRQARSLEAVIPRLFLNHGDLYAVRHTEPRDAKRRPVPVARVVHRKSGRVLEVSTTESYLQFYTGVGLDGSETGKSGGAYGRHAGLCLECEGYPDGANAPDLDDIILRPGRPRREATVWAFSNLPD
jgi:aldose 1-epimerase